METARAYSRMMREFGLTQDAIAIKVGRDRSSVANFIRLTQLHPELQELIEAGRLSAGHAKVILGLPSPDDQLRLGKKVVSASLSVRATEKLITDSLKEHNRRLKPGRHALWADLEARLQKRLGTKVTVHPQKQGGRLVIHYFSKEELDGVVDILLG
jgi:ParB family chromosome partitioning protein